MNPDKQIKAQFKAEASKNPDKYYATSVLKQEGFIRKQCSCGTYFWTVNAEQQTCGDPVCSGGFRFVGKKTTELDYIGVWKKFSQMFSEAGYTPIQRYPVTARWREDTDFVQASIYDFQPYVVSGEVEPPANPLVVPQFCLRFNDIDNVGVTGAHYTGFDMIGQHAFMNPEQWNQAKYFSDIHNWLKNGLKLKNDEITFHEDAWAGGGNFGPCMEYFSRGLELGNQVYMLYEQTPAGNRELKLKVLDMGMGHERNAWFAAGTPTSYETTFPTVMAKLRKLTGTKLDSGFQSRFMPYASFLNLDESDDIAKSWQTVASKLRMDVSELKEKVSSTAALYSVAEHSRSLLVALSDGALPGNVAGSYNLRTILRRSLELIDRFGWNIELGDVAEEHASYLRDFYPELRENLDNVKKILAVEKQKYKETKSRAKLLIAKTIKSGISGSSGASGAISSGSLSGISTDKLVELYDSHGIMPNDVAEEAKQNGLNISVPENFYSLVSEKHSRISFKAATATKKELGIDISGLEPTELLYMEDWKAITSEGKVLRVQGKMIALDRTAAYPTSGGQLHDIGVMEGQSGEGNGNCFEIVEVVKQGQYVIHILADEPDFTAGDTVLVSMDFERRKQLAQHHTATHIIGAAARKVLGNHINQAGARKTLEKGTLDITHYQNVTQEEVERIEKTANDIVKKAVSINKFMLPRNEAEKKYGMRIYQGGAVPGKSIRIVEIQGIDVQACGGTHLNSTSEAGKIRIVRSSKVQDGVVRLEFTAGSAAEKRAGAARGIIEEACVLLECNPSQVPGRAKELFAKWKEAVKKNRAIDLTFSSKEESEGDTGEIVKQTAEILRTQPEHIPKIIRRFIAEINEKNLK